MKAYKIRSLIFFSCFVLAAIFYYNIEQEEKFQRQLISSDIVDMKADDANEASEQEETSLDDNFSN